MSHLGVRIQQKVLQGLSFNPTGVTVALDIVTVTGWTAANHSAQAG